VPALAVWVCMRRATFVLSATALLVLSLASLALGAGEVVVTVSPSEARVGQQVEVLLRTFVPVTAATSGLPSPRPGYPAPSGLLNMLYPWDDYPFDVRAEIDDQAVRIPLVRDVHDSTLWRAVWTPTTSGTWTVRCYNFPTGHPGASTTVRIIDAGPRIESPGSVVQESTDGATMAVAGLLGLAGGVLVTLLGARLMRRGS
jgi:hypothetical protein